jgi:hypothetical protein
LKEIGKWDFIELTILTNKDSIEKKKVFIGTFEVSHPPITKTISFITFTTTLFLEITLVYKTGTED